MADQKTAQKPHSFLIGQPFRERSALETLMEGEAEATDQLKASMAELANLLAGKTGEVPMAKDQTQHDRTFGERAVGLDFNPSGDPLVHELKELYAKIIDICDAKRKAIMKDSEPHRLWSIAITEAQGAQMWAVKSATWRDN